MGLNIKLWPMRESAEKAFKAECEQWNVKVGDLSRLLVESRCMDAAKVIWVKALPEIPLDSDGERLLKFILNVNHPDPCAVLGEQRPAYADSWPADIGL